MLALLNVTQLIFLSFFVFEYFFCVFYPWIWWPFWHLYLPCDQLNIEWVWNHFFSFIVFYLKLNYSPHDYFPIHSYLSMQTLNSHFFFFYSLNDFLKIEALSSPIAQIVLFNYFPLSLSVSFLIPPNIIHCFISLPSHILWTWPPYS